MVDKETLVHKTYPNIVSLGDVAGIPTSKTSAAIRKQVPIAAKNLISLMEGKEPAEKYDGYAACPIVTDYGHGSTIRKRRKTRSRSRCWTHRKSNGPHGC